MKECGFEKNRQDIMQKKRHALACLLKCFAI